MPPQNPTAGVQDTPPPNTQLRQTGYFELKAPYLPEDRASKGSICVKDDDGLKKAIYVSLGAMDKL